MALPHGFSYMTDEERQMLGTIQECPANVNKLSQYPSQEFWFTAAFLRPDIIRYAHKQSYWLRMIAVTLDKNTLSDLNCVTPKMRAIAESKKPVSIMDLNMPHYLLEIYANAYNFQRFGIRALNKRLAY